MSKRRLPKGRPLRLCFVIPPDYLNFQPFKNQQLTALYLLTILEQKFGDRLVLSVADLRGLSRENIPYYIAENDVYCYTAFSPLYEIICEIRDLVRTLHPASRHLAGGPHIDLFAEQCTGFDAVSVGEGETNIVAMVEDILQGELQGVYRNREAIDLNAYPYPMRKFQPVSSVVDNNFFYQDSAMRGASILFSRGCPFRCHFCANLNLGPTRYRHPDLVQEEIEYLKSEYQVKALVLRDDNAIPVNRKVAKPFLQAIRRTDVKWRGLARANGIQEDMVALAAESGCLDLALGVESVSPRVLNIINKKIDLDEVKSFIKMLKKHRIGVKLLLILGLPGETDDVVARTLEFIDQTEPNVIGLALFCPFPGSRMTSRHSEFGIKNINPNLSEYQVLYGRFDAGEKPRLMFEYEEKTPWGKGMPTGQILENYQTLQDELRRRNLNF